MTKDCVKCKYEKELSKFSKRKSAKDGLAPWCKLCMSEYNKNTPPHIVNELSNLQPLWAKDNLSKGNKIIEQ